MRIWISVLNERVWLARDKDGKMFSLFYIIWYVHLALGMVLRSGQENQMLEDRFGTEWHTWSKKVRFKLVPGLY